MASVDVRFPLVYCAVQVHAVYAVMESVCCGITGSNGLEGTSAVVV